MCAWVTFSFWRPLRKGPISHMHPCVTRAVLIFCPFPPLSPPHTHTHTRPLITGTESFIINPAGEARLSFNPLQGDIMSRGGPRGLLARARLPVLLMLVFAAAFLWDEQLRPPNGGDGRRPHRGLALGPAAPSSSTPPAITAGRAPRPLDASRRTLTLLSTDFHTGPIRDLKSIAKRHPDLKLRIRDLSLSQACHHVGTCANADTLKVLRQGEPKHSLYFDRATRMAFFDAYRQEQLRTPREGLLGDVDAVICSHPSGGCELYMPFNTSVLIWATTRFEQGRELDAVRMAGLVRNVRAIASLPWNVVAANNPYDVAYINYYTGITPLLLPSLCAYPEEVYTWNGVLEEGNMTLGQAKGVVVTAAEAHRSRLVLVFGYRPGLQQQSLKDFIQPANSLSEAVGSPFRFENINEAYERRYEYSELAAHPAVLHLPYQVSVMSFYEQYQMGLPIFAPSLDLLTQWHLEYIMVSERGWGMRRQGGSIVPRHPQARSDLIHDPYDDMTAAAVRAWLSFGDYFLFPHVILFDSWEDLADMLVAVDFRAVSAAMLRYAAKHEQELVEKWDKTLSRLASRPALIDALIDRLDSTLVEDVEKDYTARMDAIYGKGKWDAY
jgi:hypothetical protein